MADQSNPSLYPTAIASDLANLGFGIYDRVAGRDSGSAGDDARFMNDFAWKQSLRNEDYQKNYLQYRSADAIAAGLHPLAALGVNVGSGPSAAAFSGVTPKSPRAYSDMSNLGQNTLRAQLAQATASDRAIAAATVRKLDSETALNNRTQIPGQSPALDNSQLPPPAPMDVSNKYQLVKNAMGRYEWILSPQASQGIMSDPIRMWAESLQNAFAGPETYPLWKNAWKSLKRIVLPFNPYER